jgi:hypothetical protein
VLIGRHAFAMEYQVIPAGGKEIIIGMDGPIVEGDAQKFLVFIKHIPQANSLLLFGFALHSPGGLITEAETITKMIRSIHGSRTIVGDGNICASACFLIFAAGQKKMVHYRGKIMVHATSSDEQLENIAALAATTAMARDAAELGVPASVIAKIVVTPPGRVNILSRADLMSMGAILIDEKGHYHYPPDNHSDSER